MTKDLPFNSKIMKPVCQRSAALLIIKKTKITSMLWVAYLPQRQEVLVREIGMNQLLSAALWLNPVSKRVWLITLKRQVKGLAMVCRVRNQIKRVFIDPFFRLASLDMDQLMWLRQLDCKSQVIRTPYNFNWQPINRRAALPSHALALSCLFHCNIQSIHRWSL